MSANHNGDVLELDVQNAHVQSSEANKGLKSGNGGIEIQVVPSMASLDGRQGSIYGTIEEKRPEKGWKYKLHRIFIGKDAYQENYEKKHLKNLHFWKKELRRHMAEYIGTFFLIFFVAGIQVNQDMYPEGGVANIDKGLVSGFLLVGLIYSFGNISGAHFNPCVTLAFLMRGSFSPFRTISYIIVQFAGAVTGAAVLYGLFGNVGPGLGTTTPGGIADKNAFGIEILITFLLINVILHTAECSKLLGPTSAIAVGLTFGAIELWAWNFTGASVNPWRTIGPTMISDVGWDTYWIYIVGPLLGTILAVLVQRLFVTGSERKEVFKLSKGRGKVLVKV